MYELEESFRILRVTGRVAPTRCRGRCGRFRRCPTMGRPSSPAVSRAHLPKLDVRRCSSARRRSIKSPTS